MNKQLIKILLSSLIVGIPFFTTVDAKADDGTDMPAEDLEMKQETDSEPESGAYDSIDEGYDGEPVVTIPETEGTINVIVKNNTNAAIDYQAIGFTENQTLEGGEEHTLQGLPVPVVIRAARQDDGFVTTEPMINDEGVLEIALDETDERNLTVIRIEEDGGVYLNEDTEAGVNSEDDSMSDEGMDLENMENMDDMQQ